MADRDTVSVWSQLFQELQSPGTTRNDSQRPHQLSLGFGESWLRPPHRDVIIRRLDRLAEVTVAPPEAKKPGMWPPPSCKQYGLQEVPNLVSDDILAGLNFVLGNQALEWGEAHTSAGLSPGFGESFVPSFRSKRRSMTGAEQMFTE